MQLLTETPPSPERNGAKTSAPTRIIFAGNPNCGKTTLFNRFTGLRARTANFPGTTVELRRAVRRESGTPVEFVDLPGMYGLSGNTPEERIAADYLRECAADPGSRTLVVVVVDATRLERNLYLVSQIREIVSGVVVALNMADLASRKGLSFETAALGEELGAPVVELSARTGAGVGDLRGRLQSWLKQECPLGPSCPPCVAACSRCVGCPHRARFQWARDVSGRVSRHSPSAGATRRTEKMDRWATHPVAGLVLFVLVMGALFQALFWLAETPMDWIDTGFASLREAAAASLPAGYLSGFVVDGLLTGIAGMVMFLPQICILFFLLAILEDTGYLARAAFVADRWMALVGLPGKAFLPILSAHACAIPAVMSTRTIENPRDRLVATLVLPLFTCSARIPVYIMVTAMLFPHSPGTAGLVFAGAYFLGIFAAFFTALLIRGSLLKGRAEPLIIELPNYNLPSLRTALLTMLDRGWLFLRKAGTVIVGIIVVLWALAQFPVLPESAIAEHGETGAERTVLADAETPPVADRDVPEFAGGDPEADRARMQLEHSVVGRIGRAVEPVFAPLGFDWKITVGILTSFAAREVVVSTLSVLYGLGESEDAQATIVERLRTHLPPAAGLSLLVFFVLAMQCLPTQIVTRRETGSWKWPLLQLAYMSLLAYSAAFITYQVASRIIGS